MNATEDITLKQKKTELSAYEGRIATAKAEVDNLNKEKESLKTQVEDVRRRCNQEVTSKLGEARQSAILVEEDRTKLESDKKEFEGILNAFKAERVAFDREKQAAEDVKTEARLTLERIGKFIRLVREEAVKL